jgi:hypothetical protein
MQYLSPSCNVPLLFLLVLDGVLRRALDGKKKVLTWRLKESLEDMEYADDICLVSHKRNWMISRRNLRKQAFKLIF